MRTSTFPEGVTTRRAGSDTEQPGEIPVGSFPEGVHTERSAADQFIAAAVPLVLDYSIDAAILLAVL